jgi:hypothetical protein
LNRRGTGVFAKNIKQYLGANKIKYHWLEINIEPTPSNAISARTNLAKLTLSENEIPDVGQFIPGDDPLSESINNDNNVIHDISLDNLNENTICNKLTKLKGFRVGHINITSLTKHIEQLRFYLHDKPLDILSVNETRLDHCVDNNILHIEGYSTVRKDRSREGGGVAIYFRDHLNVKERCDLVPEHLEAVCIEVSKIKSKPTIVTSLYRLPNSRIEIFDSIENLI